MDGINIELVISKNVVVGEGLHSLYQTIFREQMGMIMIRQV